MVVHCEHPCRTLQKMTLLAVLSGLSTKILKGLNATLTAFFVLLLVLLAA